MGLYKTFAKSSDLASFLHVNVEALTSNQLRLLDRANEFVSNQISDDDFNTAQLTALSHNIPSVKVSNTKSAQAFLNDDGGY